MFVWEPGKDSRTDICKMWFDHWLWKSIEALLIFTHGCKIGSRQLGTQWRHWENQSVGALIKGGEWDFVFTTKTNDPLLKNPSHVRQLALLSQVPTINIGANFLSQPSGKSVTPLSLLRIETARCRNYPPKKCRRNSCVWCKGKLEHSRHSHHPHCFDSDPGMFTGTYLLYLSDGVLEPLLWQQSFWT